MSTEEPKPEPAQGSDAKAEPASASSGTTASPPPGDSARLDAAVAWPPPEAAPSAADDGKPAADASGAGEAAPASDVAPVGVPARANGKAPVAPEAAAPDPDVMTAPEASPAAKPAGDADAEIPAATPQEEMGLSNSTLHWLEDGDQAVPSRLTEPGTMPSYDPRAPVPGRKRAFLVVGLAGAVALIIAGALYAQAEKHKATQAPVAATAEPARDLTTRAEAALAASRYDEALELARLALVADQRFADAHFVVASVARARNQAAEARDEFRRYLELAPLGTHAEAARAGLASLPP